MKIVFLDIDGVLNTSQNYSEYNAARERPDKFVPAQVRDEDSYVDLLFDKKLIQSLNTFTEATQSKIVISSSWRHFYAPRFDRLQAILARCGVTAEVLGPTLPTEYDRAEAIRCYLRGIRLSAPQFVILDDEFNASFGDLGPWHVHVNDAVGFVPSLHKWATRILMGGNQWSGS